MAEKDSDGVADSVSQLSARFDRLESLVTECLTREKPAVGQCAASVAEDHDNADRRLRRLSAEGSGSRLHSRCSPAPTGQFGGSAPRPRPPLPSPSGLARAGATATAGSSFPGRVRALRQLSRPEPHRITYMAHYMYERSSRNILGSGQIETT